QPLIGRRRRTAARRHAGVRRAAAPGARGRLRAVVFARSCSCRRLARPSRAAEDRLPRRGRGARRIGGLSLPHPARSPMSKTALCLLSALALAMATPPQKPETPPHVRRAIAIDSGFLHNPGAEPRIVFAHT